MFSKHYQLIKATEIRVLLLKKQSRVCPPFAVLSASYGGIYLLMLDSAIQTALQ